MALIDLLMPKLGESIMEATILHWNKKPGDFVKLDEPILEIATDKVDSEVPSIAEGEISEILFQENDVVPVGSVIARIKTQGSEFYLDSISNSPISTNEQPAQHHFSFPNLKSYSHDSIDGNSGYFSPLVLTIAKNEGISVAELEKIPGTGNEQRLTKRDLLLYIEKKKLSVSSSGNLNRNFEKKAGTTPPQVTALSFVEPSRTENNFEIIEMDRMRKLIAEHMIRSKQTSAHVTSFSESDVTSLVRWREKTKMGFEKREGEKLTFTPLFIEALVKCIKRFPILNSSVDGERIIIKKEINIGMATALPNGNLIVPVIRNADMLNLVGLVRQVNYLAQAARTGKLHPEDTQGGTFTLTNVGTFGSLMGTPIINQPQVAILAVGAIKKRPVVVESNEGDSIAIRHIMYLSLSYDHRIIDGSLGATFTTSMAVELEQFNFDREF